MNTISPAIRAENLSLRYGRKSAFEGVSLGVLPGQVTALIGPSGCGKTSFLHCINRMTDYVDKCKVSGELRLHGADVLGKNVDVIGLRKRVGMIFQKPNPFPLSIYRNLSMPLKYHGVRSRGDRDSTIERVLSEVGLWDEVKDRLHSGAVQLSGGQQQRLCIARALALDPEVLLMDEPCSALDPISTSKVEKLIEDLRGKRSVVIVTHNLGQARRVSDRTAVFWQIGGCGKIVDEGPTARVFTDPNHEMARGYIWGEFG